jgi:hypothetical protein
MREFDIGVETVYNDVMEMKKMTFAPGWTQSIDTGGTREREDLASFISDTFKAINGIRPRWWDFREWSLADLRVEAQSLEDEVVESIKQDKRDAHEQMLEANRVAVIYRAAKKPVSRTFKPFANLKEMLV